MTILRLGDLRNGINSTIKELKKSSHLVREVSEIIILTLYGLQIIEKIYKHHRFFKQQLIDLGVDPKTAEADACGMEHGISDESFVKLRAKYQRET